MPTVKNSPSKRRRSEAEMMLGGKPGPFEHLVEQFGKAKGERKDRLALELMPYIKPKLKAIDVTQSTDVKVTVTIGGIDGDS